jgi:hypothetical protein
VEINAGVHDFKAQKSNAAISFQVAVDVKVIQTPLSIFHS